MLTSWLVKVTDVLKAVSALLAFGVGLLQLRARHGAPPPQHPLERHPGPTRKLRGQPGAQRRGGRQ